MIRGRTWPGWPKSKKSERRQLIEACDALIRKIVLLRDKVCQRTGRSKNLQVAHFYSRRNLRVRFDLDNVCLLSGGAHIYWGHQNPQEFCEWWQKRLGPERFERLKLKARYVCPVKTWQLELLKLDLQQKLEYFTH